MTNDMYSKVREFHETFNLPVNDIPEVPDEATVQLRHDLLKEEYLEYVEALMEANRIEVADALADILYIAYGNALVYGIGPFDIDHTYRESSTPFGKNYSDSFLRFSSLYTYRYDLYDYTLWLVAIIKWALEESNRHQIPIIEVFNEVHRSNMSKLTADGKVLLREDGKVLKSDQFSEPDIRGVLYNYDKVVD